MDCVCVCVHVNMGEQVGTSKCYYLPSNLSSAGFSHSNCKTGGKKENKVKFMEMCAQEPDRIFS